MVVYHKNLIRDYETTILNILGTEILEYFQNDLSSNFKLEMTTDHIPGLSGNQFCWFLVIWKRLILIYEKYFENEKKVYVLWIAWLALAE